MGKHNTLPSGRSPHPTGPGCLLARLSWAEGRMGLWLTLCPWAVCRPYHHQSTPGGLASCSFSSCSALGGNSDDLLRWVRSLVVLPARRKPPYAAEGPVGLGFGQARIWGRPGTKPYAPRLLSFDAQPMERAHGGWFPWSRCRVGPAYLGNPSPSLVVWVLGSRQWHFGMVARPASGRRAAGRIAQRETGGRAGLPPLALCLPGRARGQHRPLGSLGNTVSSHLLPPPGGNARSQQ